MTTEFNALCLVFLTIYASIFPSVVYAQSFVDPAIAERLETLDPQETKIYYGFLLQDYITWFGEESIKGKMIITYEQNVINKANTLEKQQEINPKLTADSQIILLSQDEYKQVEKELEKRGVKGWFGITLGSYFVGTFLDMTFDAVIGGASQMWNNYSNNQPIFNGVGERVYNNFWRRFND